MEAEVNALAEVNPYNTNCPWTDQPSAKSGLKRRQLYCPKKTGRVT